MDALVQQLVVWASRSAAQIFTVIPPRHMNLALSVVGIYAGYKAPVIIEYVSGMMSAVASFRWRGWDWWFLGTYVDNLFGGGEEDTSEDVSISVDDLQATVDKISLLLSDSPNLGLFVTKGPKLDVISANGMFRKLVGWPPAGEGEPVANHNNVICPLTDLLPASFHATHNILITRMMESNELPKSLRHPLRSVELVTTSGAIIKVNLTIATLTKKLPLEHPDALFYVLVSPIETLEDASWENVAEGIYGSNAASHVAHGKLPPPEQYEDATVLVFDVVGYTKRCAQLSASNVAQWMTSVHQAVEAVIAKFCVRKIETRGDCYAMVSGTEWVEGDSAETQVSRMVNLAKEVSGALQRINNTEIRVGLSLGPISVTYIGTHHLASTLCAFGKAMNEAAKLESSGTKGLVHLSEDCATRYLEEQARLGFTDISMPAVDRAPSDDPLQIPSLLFNPAARVFVMKQ
mmetsp:Transcript_26608/g.51868  ORF Transcript_26608/g.51868 Transcript_26608/m.51868 type:complete len:462 (+) Transcript_26608:113-1498(+)